MVTPSEEENLDRDRKMGDDIHVICSANFRVSSGPVDSQQDIDLPADRIAQINKIFVKLVLPRLMRLKLQSDICAKGNGNGEVDRALTLRDLRKQGVCKRYPIHL